LQRASRAQKLVQFVIIQSRVNEGLFEGKFNKLRIKSRRTEE
jgi:hypothetical protein